MYLKIAGILNFILVAGIIIFSITVYPELPEKIPSHLNFECKADAWTNTSIVVWMLLPCFSVFLTVIFYFIVRLIRNKPRWVNIPNKKLFLKLTEEQREPIVKIIRTLMVYTALLCNAIFFEIQYVFYLNAVKDSFSGHLDTVILFGLLAAMIFMVVIFTMKINAAIKKAALSTK